MFNGLRQKMTAEKKKMSKMAPREKREYILEYYKVHIGFLVLFVAAVAGILWQLIFNNQKAVYNFAIVNEIMDVERDKNMMEALSVFWALNPRSEKVVVDSNYNIPYLYDEQTDQMLYADGSPAADYSTYDKFFLNLSGGVIDAAVIPEDFLNYCNGLDTYFYDLELILPEDFLNTYSGRFCYGTDVWGEQHLFGLFMDGTDFDPAYFAASADKEVQEAYGRQVLVFPKTQKNGGRNEAFIRFLMEQHS